MMGATATRDRIDRIVRKPVHAVELADEKGDEKGSVPYWLPPLLASLPY